MNQEESQEQATDPASKLTSSTTSKLEGGTSSCPPSGSHNEALDHPSVDLWEALGSDFENNVTLSQNQNITAANDHNEMLCECQIATWRRM